LLLERAADKPYALADFDGLFLNISPNGTKAWHFRFSWAGKRERISFGTYPVLSLKEAVTCVMSRGRGSGRSIKYGRGSSSIRQGLG